MSATHNFNSTASFAPVLYVAFELSSGQWKLASTAARGQRARVVSVQAASGRCSKIARVLSLQSSLSMCNVRTNRSIRRATFERATSFIVQSSPRPRPAVAQLSGTGRPRHSS
jgi:hypothetical protein